MRFVIRGVGKRNILEGTTEVNFKQALKSLDFAYELPAGSRERKSDVVDRRSTSPDETRPAVGENACAQLHQTKKPQYIDDHSTVLYLLMQGLDLKDRECFPKNHLL